MTTAHAHFSARLLAWYDRHGRKDLPWQIHRSPYAVWLSEIMLQQTQVRTVIPYFNRFMEHFPNIQSLAAAPQDSVMGLWAGLGYYARARNLHQTAQIICRDFAGNFPQSFADLIALPGIGRSTAGAILSLAFDQPFPILDSNVRRVLSRVFALDTTGSQSQDLHNLWQLAERLVPPARCAAYTQAQMDLGALVCKPTPNCTRCPVQTDCLARKKGTVSDYPTRGKRLARPTKTLYWHVLRTATDQYFLERRASSGIWGGLWCFPESLSPWCSDQPSPVMEPSLALAPIRHTLTHFTLEIHPQIYLAQDPTVFMGQMLPACWVTIPQAMGLALPAPVKKFLLSQQ